jgi:hypothetical protein
LIGHDGALNGTHLKMLKRRIEWQFSVVSAGGRVWEWAARNRTKEQKVYDTSNSNNDALQNEMEEGELCRRAACVPSVLYARLAAFV